MAEQRTAWHYFLGLLLTEKAPGNFEVRAEEPLTRAVQRMDWLILRRVPTDAPPTPGTTLVELWPLLPGFTILEFKSLSKGYRPGDVYRLIGYTHQYFSANMAEVAAPLNLMMVLMVAMRNSALDRDLADLHVREHGLQPGYVELRGLAFPALLVDLATITERMRGDYIALFAANAHPSAEAGQWWYAHHGTAREGTMDPTQLEGFDEMQRQYLNSLPVEQRLAGLAPEQRLAGLAPEEITHALPSDQRLAGVAEPEQLLALSPHILQQLPDDYIASLPADVQARVRARRGR